MTAGGRAEVTVHLSAGGQLAVDLPGGRELVIGAGQTAAGALQRILVAREAGETRLAEDGAPTMHQLWHWQHKDGSRDKCPFCTDSGRWLGALPVGAASHSKPRKAAKVLPSLSDLGF